MQKQKDKDEIKQMHLSDWLTATNKCFPHLGLAPGAPEGAADQSEAERGEPRSIDLVGPSLPRPASALCRGAQSSQRAEPGLRSQLARSLGQNGSIVGAG